MNEKNLRAEKATDGSADIEEPADCGCTSGLSCFEHYEIAIDDGGPEAESAISDGGLTRVPHTPDLGDLYVIGDNVYEVATFADGGSAVVFESVAPPTREVVMPLSTARTTDAARYVQ